MISDFENFTDLVEEQIKNITSLEAQDRLDYVNNIKKCNYALLTVAKVSINFIEKVELTSLFSQEEMKELFIQLRELVLLCLNHDLEWRKKLLEKLKSEFSEGVKVSYVE